MVRATVRLAVQFLRGNLDCLRRTAFSRLVSSDV